ncbi:MAG: ABC transporter permease [Actinomycetota bacterium]
MQPADTTERNDLATLEAGLDALESIQVDKTPLGKRFVKAAVPAVLSIVGLIAIWQFLYALKIWPDWKFPGPGQVWRSLGDQWEQGLVWSAVRNSVSRGLIGFAMSAIIATPLAVLIKRVGFARSVLRPILSGLQQLPSVAWVPAAIIWFGLTPTTIYAVVILGATPSITNGLVNGIDQIPPIYLRAAKVLGLGRLDNVRRVVLPAALPTYLSGLEQGWAFAWRSLMAAELIAISPALGNGLGQTLETGRQLGDMSLIVTAILLILAAGILVEKLGFAPIRRRVYRNRGLAVA